MSTTICLRMRPAAAAQLQVSARPSCRPSFAPFSNAVQLQISARALLGQHLPSAIRVLPLTSAKQLTRGSVSRSALVFSVLVLGTGRGRGRSSLKGRRGNSRARAVADAPDGLDLSKAEEYEDLLKGAQSVEDGTNKYKVSLERTDPIVASLLGSRVGATEVRSFELLESRWNGNEILKYETDKGRFCVKMNRVEAPEVFTAESLGLVSMAKASPLVRAPKPLDLGILPKVGEIGPGSFMVMEWIDVVPFGVWRPGNQATIGTMLAEMHRGSFESFEGVHKGRYGFPVNNWLSITSQDNAWKDTWVEFFATRLQRQLSRAYATPVYGGVAGEKGAYGPLLGQKDGDEELNDLGQRVIGRLDQLVGAATVRPALLHGDLWIGNVVADVAGPVFIDPASYFGHSEMELSIMSLFGGYTEEFHESYHRILPKTEGFEVRQKLYQSYHWLNQFNLFGDPRAKDSAVALMRQVLDE